jgi:hypothetical protein
LVDNNARVVDGPRWRAAVVSAPASPAKVDELNDLKSLWRGHALRERGIEGRE